MYNSCQSSVLQLDGSCRRDLCCTNAEEYLAVGGSQEASGGMRPWERLHSGVQLIECSYAEHAEVVLEPVVPTRVVEQDTLVG